MKEIVALDVYVPAEGMLYPVFLAGGITGCPDWQSKMVRLLKDTDLTLLNPRRKSFDMTDPQHSMLQIAWEHRHLFRASAILFWFPKETLCPITLYELGRWAGERQKRIFVGAHPDYARRIDVVTQLALERPEIKVVDNLEDLASQVIAAFPQDAMPPAALLDRAYLSR
jgi:hypothetical protein